MSTTILIAGGEPDGRSLLKAALMGRGHQVELAVSGAEVLDLVQREEPAVSLVVLDLKPYKDGLTILKELQRSQPGLPVIVVSGDCSPANIVTAMKLGAADFLDKPTSHARLCTAIEKALPRAQGGPAQAELVARNTAAPLSVVGTWSYKLNVLLESIGASEVPVLLQGETGVGKEVLARRLHAKSARANQAFLKLNCAALPAELVESELFGYERGAFTGAFRHTPGKFEMANHGTMFLDEIGDMDFKLQAKLLQVLQDHEFKRLGASETTKLDIRVMAATHCNLEQAIAEGRFREDLYFRLNIIDIHIPPLRERKDEILPLAQLFIETHASPYQPALPIPNGMRDALLEYPWPGNIRELENYMRKYLVLRNAEAIVEQLARQARRRKAEDRRPGPRAMWNYDEQNSMAALEFPQAPSPAAGGRRTLGELEKEDSPGSWHAPKSAEGMALEDVANAHKAAEAEAILAALNSVLWNRKKAAALLKIDYKALLYKMDKLGIGGKKAAV